MAESQTTPATCPSFVSRTRLCPRPAIRLFQAARRGMPRNAKASLLCPITVRPLESPFQHLLAMFHCFHHQLRPSSISTIETEMLSTDEGEQLTTQTICSDLAKRSHLGDLAHNARHPMTVLTPRTDSSAFNFLYHWYHFNRPTHQSFNI